MQAILKTRGFREAMLFAGLFGAAVTLSAIFPEMSFATSLISPDDNIGAVAGATGGEGSLKDLVQVILNYFLAFLGFVATIMVIYGGILYVTSAGNEESVGKAKNILMYAVTGIVIILISFALINTVLQAGGGDTGAGTGTTTTVGP
jgi:hypothetical protein